MLNLKKVSLQTKIIGLVAAVLALTSVGSLVSMQMVERNYQKTISDSLVDNSREFGVKVSRRLHEHLDEMNSMVLNQTVVDLDSRALPELLDKYVSLYGAYDLLLVVDAQGRPVASSSKDLEGREVDVKTLKSVSYANASWFKAAMEEGGDVDPAFKGVHYEDFGPDAVMKLATGTARPGNGFSVPIRAASGRVVGVLTGRANPVWFEEDFKDAYETLKDQDMPSARITLVNKNGFIVNSYDPSNANGDMTIRHDASVILKFNMVKSGYQPGILAAEGKAGFMETPDPFNPRGVEIAGYSHIEGSAWPKTIGWSVILSADSEDAFGEIHQANRLFWFSFAACLLLSAVFGWVFARSVSKTIGSATDTLARNASEVQTASQQIAASATQLSEASTEQAAALQETVAAVDEISAMVEKNAEAANHSKERSNQSREAAERGREIVTNMIQAIGDIDRANEAIAEQMKTSNGELSEITSLINEIGSKTRVINDIVFQTKLLSFNASVEAARAGEYGKGFAVVAEEVGNLAEMSGGAAKEISTLLETSVRKVEQIVEQTKTRVEKLTIQSKEKVQSGSAIAGECNGALEQILENVRSVDTLVSEIAVASSEQSTGIHEISKAVSQLEIVTQQNTSVAQSSSVAAGQLSGQSDQLNSLVGDLAEIVSGKRDAKASAAPKVSPRTRSQRAHAETHVAHPTKILSMKHKSRMPSKKDVSEPVESSFKAVASSDIVPSGNDPRFED